MSNVKGFMMGAEHNPPVPVQGHLDDGTLALLGDLVCHDAGEHTHDEVRRFAAELVADDASIDDRWREPALLAAADHLAACATCLARRTVLLTRTSERLAAEPSTIIISAVHREQAVRAALDAFDHVSGAPAALPSPERRSWWTRIGLLSRAGATPVGGGSGGAISVVGRRWAVAAAFLGVAAVAFALRPGGTSQLDTVALAPTTTSAPAAGVQPAPVDSASSGIAAAEATPAEAAADNAVAETAPPTEPRSPAHQAAEANDIFKTAPTLGAGAAGPPPSAKTKAIPSPPAAAAGASSVRSAPPTAAPQPPAPAKKVAKSARAAAAAPTPTVAAKAASAPVAAAAGSVSAASSADASTAASGSGSSAPSYAVGDAPDAETLAGRFENQTNATGRASGAAAPTTAATVEIATAAPSAGVAAPSAAPGPSPVLACPLAADEQVIAVGTGTVAGRPVGLRRVRRIDASAVGSGDSIDVLDLPTCAVVQRRPVRS